jgi:hypothetical protein
MMMGRRVDIGHSELTVDPCSILAPWVRAKTLFSLLANPTHTGSDIDSFAPFRTLRGTYLFLHEPRRQ